MNRNLVGSIYGRPSIKIAHFVLIDRQFFFLIGRFLKIFSSENTWPNKAKFYRKYLLKVLYQISHFIPIGQKTWSKWAFLIYDWLEFKKSPLKLGGAMNCYFVGMMYGRSCTKFPYFVLIIQLILLP